jgi:hypothetical protein
MKKLMLLCGLLGIVLGSAAAQTFNPAGYEETSLSGFTGWKSGYSGEEERKFKIPVLFSSGADLRLVFTDSGLEEEIVFETEKTWPAMTSGQKLTIYFTVQGPWVWDRRLDAIDYGGGQVALAAGTLAPAGNGAKTEDIPASPTSPARVPAANPTPDEIASSRESPPDGVPPASAGFDYGRAPQAASPRRIVVYVSGQAPRQGRYYRLQVGSYAVRSNAARAANSLKNAGLYPAFEEYQNKVRVVLPQVPGKDVVETAMKIGSAGFSDVWCREEP